MIFHKKLITKHLPGSFILGGIYELSKNRTKSFFDDYYLPSFQD